MAYSLAEPVKVPKGSENSGPFLHGQKIVLQAANFFQLCIENDSHSCYT